MNLFDGYRYLAALHQHRHFGRAAASCHITQPALSNALRALEEHFGVPLVRRGRQFEGFTPEGEQVLATAHRMLHEQESLQQLLKSSVGQPTGRLVIGAVPTALPMAARFVSRLLQRHPGAAAAAAVAALAGHRAGPGHPGTGHGAGLLRTGAAAPAGAASVPERYYLLQRTPTAGSALQRGEPLAWADAATHTLALLAPEMHNRAIVDGVFSGLGLKVQPALETNSVLVLLAAVQAGGLATVVPGALVSTVAGQGSLLARPLVRPEATTPIGMLVLDGARQTLALQAALGLARDSSWLAEARAHSGALEP